MRGDLLLSALLTALGLVMYAEALLLPEGLFGTLGPGYFPKIVLGCLIAASGLLTLRLFIRVVTSGNWGAATAKEDAPSFHKRYRFVALTFIAFFAYLISMRWIGFLAATLLFMLVTMWFLAPSEKNWGTVRVIVLTSVLLSFGIYALFTYGFTVMLPVGALF